MNPWWSQQEWPCICQGDDPYIHTHYDDSVHHCARCLECKGYQPRIPLKVGIRILLGPEMTNEQAATILLGPNMPAKTTETPTHVCGKCEHAIVPWGNTCPRCGSGELLIRVKEWIVPTVTQAIVDAAAQKAALEYPDLWKPCCAGTMAGSHDPLCINFHSKPGMLAELKDYLDTLTITSENIGGIRASLGVPWNSQWNGWVRDETARRENTKKAQKIGESIPCPNGVHEWSNQFGEDWTPDEGTLCDCRKKKWGIPL